MVVPTKLAHVRTNSLYPFHFFDRTPTQQISALSYLSGSTMAFASSSDYSLWPTEAPSNPTSMGSVAKMNGVMSHFRQKNGEPSNASQLPTDSPSKKSAPFTASQLLEQRQFAEYQRSLTTIPAKQGANHSALPLPVGLPPAIPFRCPAVSPEKNVEESITISSRSGCNHIQRSTSDGYTVFQSDEKACSLIRVTQLKPSRSSNSPKPPRQFSSRNFIESPSPLMNVVVGGVDGQGIDTKSPIVADKLQHRRRPSIDSSDSTRHRRSHSADVPRGERLRRSTSNGSLTSYALDSEAVKMLPDPRWGGAVGSIARSRSFSGDNVIQTMGNDDVGLYSATSSNPYGSIMGTDNNDMCKSVLLNNRILDQQPRLHSTKSEVSITSHSSGVSVDRSVEPVMTDMTKSAMYKGITNKGIVKLQLPKDNFRLLSDRDLGEKCVLV